MTSNKTRYEILDTIEYHAKTWDFQAHLERLMTIQKQIPEGCQAEITYSHEDWMDTKLIVGYTRPATPEELALEDAAMKQQQDTWNAQEEFARRRKYEELKAIYDPPKPASEEPRFSTISDAAVFILEWAAKNPPVPKPDANERDKWIL